MCCRRYEVAACIVIHLGGVYTQGICEVGVSILVHLGEVDVL